MPVSTAIVVALIIALFVGFAGVLAWVDHHASHG